MGKENNIRKGESPNECNERHKKPHVPFKIWTLVVYFYKQIHIKPNFIYYMLLHLRCKIFHLLPKLTGRKYAFSAVIFSPSTWKTCFRLLSFLLFPLSLTLAVITHTKSLHCHTPGVHFIAWERVIDILKWGASDYHIRHRIPDSWVRSSTV